MSNKPTPQQVEAAREVLRNAGYYVDNLWTIHDVQGMYEASDETAMKILDGALCDNSTMEHTFDVIQRIATLEELKEVDQ
mgnify:CR=1 FL=1|jgi:hypothetical protein